jgi:hypothetical protein
MVAWDGTLIGDQPQAVNQLLVLRQPGKWSA